MGEKGGDRTDDREEKRDQASEGTSEGRKGAPLMGPGQPGPDVLALLSEGLWVSLLRARKIRAPVSVRNPSETFCPTLTMRRSCSAWLLVKGIFGSRKKAGISRRERSKRRRRF